MKLFAAVPYAFQTGELLDPSRVNEDIQAVADYDAEVSGRRFTRSALVLRFMADMQTPYTNATSAEGRAFRLSFPKTVVVERAYFSYADTAIGTTINVNVTVAGTGLAPPGITNPWLTLSGATGAGVEATALTVVPLTLAAGGQFRIELTATGAFSAVKAELVLHLMSDRFQDTSGADAHQRPAPILLTQASDLGAATFLAAAASVVTPAAANLAAANLPGFKASCFNMPALTSATAALLARWDIPRCTSSLRRQRISAVVIYAVLAVNGAAGQTVTWTLQDQTGATLQAFSASVAGVTFATLTTSGLTIDLSSATLGIKSDGAQDYRLVCSTNGATTIQKTYCYLIWE